MTDHEITALAREYAEEIRKDILPFFPRPLPESMEVLVKADQEKAERLIRFLLRRYCLVEKEKAQQVKNCINTKAVDVVMNLLFPDLGKEVES